MNSLKLSWKNIKFRPLQSGLSILLLASGMSIVIVLLQAQIQIEEKFKKNLTNIDLVVGPKGSPTQLLMSTIYHIGDPIGNIQLSRTKSLRLNPFVDNLIEVSIGDNYEGYRIVGTTPDYIGLYDGQFSEGKIWDKPMQIVVGSSVARKFNLSTSSKPIAGGHGIGNADALEHAGHSHDETKYEIVGVLKPTGTVLDELLLCDYKSSWIVHHGHESEGNIGLTLEEDHVEADSNLVATDSVLVEEKVKPIVHDDHSGHDHHNHDHHDHHGHHHASHFVPLNTDSVLALIPEDKKEITSIIVQYKKSPRAFYDVPNFVEKRTGFSTAKPSIVTSQVQKMLDPGIQFAKYIGIFILIISAISVFIALYSSLKDRGYEIALARVLGASKIKVFLMIIFEGLILAILGYVFTLLLSHLGLWIISGILESNFHYSFDAGRMISAEYKILGLALIIGLVSALIPAIKAYRTDISTTLSK